MNSATIGIQNANGSIGQQVIYNNYYVHNNLQLIFETEASWLNLEGSSSGQIYSGEINSINYSIDSNNLISGEYNSYISITTNVTPVQIIPVNVSVDIFDGILGDVNEDLLVNVTDIVMIITFILVQDEPTAYEEWASDLNDDGFINVVDIVTMVDIILGN